ncbi:MAG: hypothetical protein ACXVQ6_00955 [Actinomycetota bacterium]
MAEPADVEQPSPEPEASEASAPDGSAKRRARVDWRAFVRENARLLVLIGLLGTGVVLVMLGWYGAAHTNIQTEQIPYLISGGLLGLGLIIVAGIMAAGAAQERSNAALRRDIVEALTAMRAGVPDAGVRPATVSSNGHHVFVVPGGRSYHEQGCPILEGKEGIQELQPAHAAASGYAACKLCGQD